MAYKFYLIRAIVFFIPDCYMELKKIYSENCHKRSNLDFFNLFIYYLIFGNFNTVEKEPVNDKSIHITFRVL